MNILDIIIVVILLIAAITGWRSGLTQQLFSIAGLIVGLILANRYGVWAGSLVGLSAEWASVVGFIIVLIVAMVTTALLGKALKSLFHFIGLGVVDNLLGVALSCIKYLVIMAIVFILLTPINTTLEIIPQSTLNSSIGYSRIMKLGNLCTPSFEWMEIEINPYKNV